MAHRFSTVEEVLEVVELQLGKREADMIREALSEKEKKPVKKAASKKSK